MTATPLSRYQADLESSGFVADSAQANAISHLQQLYERLIATHENSEWGKRSWFKKFTDVLTNAQPDVKGLYFWGGVGRGKTYLMDAFFECLPFEQKMRTHFHRFMRRVHHELKSLHDQQDPLEIVASRLAKEARVICFDEFFVVDITDAMILANLLQGLFSRGVVLVATSNIQPDGLYENGLQRSRFIPAIALLNANCKVLNVDGGVDYRLRTLAQASLYYVGECAAVEAQLQRCFYNLLPDEGASDEGVELLIEGRVINARHVAEDIAWFDFSAVCDGPRSQNDYIELAREYHAVIVQGVPAFAGSNDDQARRFIYLVDEFYDRNVKLILSAEAQIYDLYRGTQLAFEFERTVSRVQEMQSHDYLAKPHKP